MAAKSSTDNSERKRISIPKADASVLQWWETQQDAGQSIRMLIREEIERNGYTDKVFRPVEQQPRRGRPPGSAEVVLGTGDFGDATDHSAIEAAGGHVVQHSLVEDAPDAAYDPLAFVREAAPATQAPAPTPVPAAASSGRNPIDDIMNS